MGRIATKLAMIGTTVIAVMLQGALPAGAASVSAPIASGLAGPLQFAIGSDGTLYVAQDAIGVLTAIDKKGHRNDIASENGEIAGVDATGKGTVTYTTSYEDNGTIFTGVKRVLPNGKKSTLANLFTYESTVNPDQVNSYGFQGLTSDCAAQVPPEAGGGDPYSGIIDSHPYSVAISGGTRFIADAAGNDILRVDPNGRISTVAVLPPQPLTVPDDPSEVGLPACTAKHDYNFEPVPTDVEVGPNGLLYVSTLPGGPEDGSLGPRGSVYTVNPNTGQVTRIATGFDTATNLAVAPDGTVYVAELFAGQISKVVNGAPQLVASLGAPTAAVEWANGKLYASTDVFGNGSIVTITP